MWQRAGVLLAPLLRWQAGGAPAPAPATEPAASEPSAQQQQQGAAPAAQGAGKRRRPDFVDGDDPGVRAHWAVLVAGSSGWGNYRHQADVFHAYQVGLAGVRRLGCRRE